MEQLVLDGFGPIKSTDWKWTFKDYPTEKNGLKVFSCFSCGGGSTMGYKLAGCEVIGNCEIDPEMNDVYIKNHHPKYNYCMDIRDFNQLKELPEELYNLDILDGSPPCTTFSMAGERENSWGKKKKFREGQTEQTLDDLSFVFIETVNKLRPKCMIMENVEGLLLGEAWSYVQLIYKQLHDIGYDVKHYLLKGEKMGVPQLRHRVFFIAFRNDIKFNFDRLDMYFNYKPITYGIIKSGEGIELNHNTLEYKTLSKAVKGDKDLAMIYRRNGEKERRYSAKIVWDDSVLQTILANLACYRGEEKTHINKADVIHAQTFPEDFNFLTDSFNSVAYICGMSVPPVMIKRIVDRIIDTGVFKGGAN